MLKNGDRVTVNNLDHQSSHYALFMYKDVSPAILFGKSLQAEVKTKVNDLQIKPVSPIQNQHTCKTSKHFQLLKKKEQSFPFQSFSLFFSRYKGSIQFLDARNADLFTLCTYLSLISRMYIYIHIFNSMSYQLAFGKKSELSFHVLTEDWHRIL